MVNSANYGRRTRVSRISEAVTVMGLNSIKVLTLSSSVFSMISGQELAEKFNIKLISRHLIETASIARSIAEKIEYPEPEEAFVAGILHDVGIVLMVLYYKERYCDLLAELKASDKGILENERELFGFTHCDIGAELIESWKLPTRLVFVVQNHHTTDNTGIIPEDSTLNNLVALADRMTLGPFEGYYPDAEENIMFMRDISSRLNIGSQELNKIRKESIVESVKLAEYLELDTGDLLEIVTEANSKLAELYMSMEKIYLQKRDLEQQLSGIAVETVAEPV
jgi:putative nucleotidyltransferase with HDIG domain